MPGQKQIDQHLKPSEELTITPLIAEVTRIVTPVPPTATSIPPTATKTRNTPSPTPDLRISVQRVVEQFQGARATAYSTWNVDGYYTALHGMALKSALQTIDQIKGADCRYYIIDDEMMLDYESISADRVIVIAYRTETQKRVCSGDTTYTCYDFDSRYVVDRISGQWYISEKSVTYFD